jgi:hypothetical protein
VTTPLLAAAPAHARAPFDQVKVGVEGRPLTRGFSSALGINLPILDGFARGCCYDGTQGEWTGPRFESQMPGVGGTSRIQWSVGFARTGKSTDALAKAAGPDGFPQVAGRALTVAHIQADRKVGTLKAYSTIDAEPAPGARHQASIVIDLGKRLKSIVSFNTATPAADNSGAAGLLTVNGKPASAFNRQNAETALKGVYVEGNLPPAQIKAKLSGRRVTGTLVDFAGQPVIQIPVLLKKGSKTVAKATASTRGTFTLAGGRGRYTIVASLEGTTVKKTVSLK